MKLDIKWREVKPGVWTSVAVDPRTKKTYIGHPVPTAIAKRLGMQHERTNRFIVHRRHDVWGVLDIPAKTWRRAESFQAALTAVYNANHDPANVDRTKEGA